MKYKLILVFLLMLVFMAKMASAQETTADMQFGVFDESGNFYANLKSSDIQILQNKKSVSPTSFNLKTNIPLEIIIMIDVSMSQERTLPDEKKLAEYFIQNILRKDKDKVAIVSFTGKLGLEQDLTGDFAKATDALKKIEFIPPFGYVGSGNVAGPPVEKNSAAATMGASSIWDSVRQSSESLAKIKSTDTRKAIILISDGVNTLGDSKIKDVVETSIKTGIPVYAVGIGDDYYGGVDKKTLKKVTEQTNGVLIIPNSKLENMPQEIKKLEQGLRSIYEITFVPSIINSNTRLQEAEIELINSELRKQKLKILQPKGFFLSN
jgi:Ca-activated chloride channel family protein